MTNDRLGSSGRSLRPGSGFVSNRSGGLAPYFGLLVVPILMGVAFAVEYSEAVRVKSHLQSTLDGAVLAGAGSDDKVAAATGFFSASLKGIDAYETPPVATFSLTAGKIDGVVEWSSDAGFASALFGEMLKVKVHSQATFELATAAAPCVTVLANTPQAFLVNSGAKMDAKGCAIHVHSQQNPAFIMNAGSTLDVSTLCVKGINYIRNGGTISKLETGCNVAPDSYFNTIAEPSVPTTCATSGAKDGASHSLNPGAHCNVNFNGAPKITFKPGLHIIKGPMNINSGSTVIAEGVTFYFPDTDSKIQANGSLSMTATAPTSGTYAGVLMFEKTSNPSNNANKRQFVFNGSTGEQLSGLIYLPNRDVTYNSTTNIQANKMTLVVNTLIVNSANWKFEGAGGTSGTPAKVVLSR